jgi:hypothetical protein
MTKTTAQDASGSPIVSADDLRLDRCGHAHALTRPIAHEEAVDAAGPVDAQTRPPRLGKRRTVSHSAHRHPRLLDQERTPERSHSRPATGQRQLPSSAAVASELIRRPFAGRNSCR